MSRKMLVSLKNIAISVANIPLLQDLTFSLQSGELLAIVGANGCGKSTILNILADRGGEKSHRFDEGDVRIQGEVFMQPGIKVVHLPQTIASGVNHATPDDPEDPQAPGLKARLFIEFGLETTYTHGEKLSDGQLQKRALILSLLDEGDLYLLDEPTNYLDIAGITALEDHLQQLKNAGCGIILVTHDRTLTDNLADRTLLISQRGIFQCTGGASEAWSVRERDFASRKKRSEQIKRKIRQLQEDTHAKSVWAANKEKSKIGAGLEKAYIGKMAKAMAKRAKIAQRRVEKETDRLRETKPYVPKQVKLSFPTYPIRHRSVFSMENVAFSYTARSVRLLSDVIVAAGTRDKICIMGANGAGKTTLLKLMMNRLTPVSGDCRVNSSVKTAFLPQGLKGFFTGRHLLNSFSDIASDERTIRQYLGAALIRGDKVLEEPSHLSAGELMRAAIVHSILQQAEFLFLDEPTSHLDIESISVLEQMLQEYAGGFVLISHDRSFVAAVAETLYVLEEGALRLM